MFEIKYESPDRTTVRTVRYENCRLWRSSGFGEFFIAWIDEESEALRIAESMKQFGGWLGDKKWVGGLLVRSDVLLGRLMYWQYLGLDQKILDKKIAIQLAEEIIREQGVGKLETKAPTIRHQHVMAFHPLAPVLSELLGEIAQEAPSVSSTHGTGGSRCSRNEWEYRTEVGEWYENWKRLNTRSSCTYSNCLPERSGYTSRVVPPVLAQLLYLIEGGEQIKQVRRIKGGSFDLGGIITKNRHGSSQKTRVYNIERR